jgi:hypothetical protein
MRDPVAETPRKETLKALTPREIELGTKSFSPRKSEAQSNWLKIDALFYRTIGHAETAFKINLGINIIIVIVGMALIAYAIAYSWTKSLDLYSTAFGTLGVVSFVTMFYLTPQRKIQETVGDLTQIQMCYRTYAAQWEAVNDYLYYHEENMSIDDLKKINDQLEVLTCKLVEEIEKSVGKKEGMPDEGKQPEKKPNV